MKLEANTNWDLHLILEALNAEILKQKQLYSSGSNNIEGFKQNLLRINQDVKLLELKFQPRTEFPHRFKKFVPFIKIQKMILKIYYFLFRDFYAMNNMSIHWIKTIIQNNLDLIFFIEEKYKNKND